MPNQSERVETVVRKFCEDVPVHINALVELLREQAELKDGFEETGQELANELHRLSGAASSLGFRKLGKVLDQLQSDALEWKTRLDAGDYSGLPELENKLRSAHMIASKVGVRNSRLLDRLRAMEALEASNPVGAKDDTIGHKFLDRETVLFVDDDPYVLGVMSDILRDLGVGKLLQANSGTEALSLLQTVSPTILITDWQMEPVSGMDLLKKVRSAQTPLAAETPVIMFTARKMEHDVIQAHRNGATMFLSKPIMPDRLKEALLSVVEKKFLLRASRAS